MKIDNSLELRNIGNDDDENFLLSEAANRYRSKEHMSVVTDHSSLKH